jgi:hypothetical protein
MVRPAMWTCMESTKSSHPSWCGAQATSECYLRAAPAFCVHCRCVHGCGGGARFCLCLRHFSPMNWHSIQPGRGQGLQKLQKRLLARSFCREYNWGSSQHHSWNTPLCLKIDVFRHLQWSLAPPHHYSTACALPGQ